MVTWCNDDEPALAARVYAITQNVFACYDCRAFGSAQKDVFATASGTLLEGFGHVIVRHTQIIKSVLADLSFADIDIDGVHVAAN